MNPSYTAPSTILGISRLAKKIGRERGIKHTIALDVAAKIPARTLRTSNTLYPSTKA